MDDELISNVPSNMLPANLMVCDDKDALILRYQQCVYRIWRLFPSDPLGDDPAHFLIERLEAILDRGLLTVKEPDSEVILPHITEQKD